MCFVWYKDKKDDNHYHSVYKLRRRQKDDENTQKRSKLEISQQGEMCL